MKAPPKISIGILFFSVIFPNSLIVFGENWPGFRGPSFNGSSQARDLPVIITKNDNLKWKSELPGPGTSTPAVWNNSVFLTSVDKKEGGIAAVRVSLETGEIVWSHPICQEISRDRRSDFTGPSPTTDGRVVIFLTGHGDLVGFDFKGNQLWNRNLQDDYGKFALKWTYSSSPVLFEGILYVQILQRNEVVDGDIPGTFVFPRRI